MEPWLRDARFALRRIRMAPGFTLFAIASLALGIGVSTAIYSAVRTLLWTPLSIAEPERTMAWTPSGSLAPAVSWLDFLDVRSAQTSFSSVAAARRLFAAVSMGDTVETVFGESVSGEYFATLGVSARAGRMLHTQDETSRARVAVVSQAFWRTRLHSDPAVVGRSFKLNGEPFEIVGVVDGPFQGVHQVLPAAIWVPEVSVPDRAGQGFVARVQRDRNSRSFIVWGRLKPGVTAAQATAEVSVIARRLDSEYPLRAQGAAAGVLSARTWLLRDATQAAGDADRADALGAAIVFAVATVLLIACTNLANLSLAKGTSRMQDTSVRTALGASRARLVREQLIESGLITFAGAVLGIGLLAVLNRLFEADLPIGQNVVIHFKPEVNGEVLAVCGAATMLASLVFGLWPALQSTRGDIRSGLGAGGAATPARWRVHQTLVAWQVAGSMAMVLVAAMCVKVVTVVGARDPGIDYQRLALSQLDFALNGKDETRARALLEDIIATARSQAGVEHVSVSTGLPFGMMGPPVFAARSEEPFTAGRNAGHYTHRIGITPDTFATLGMRIVRGRGFTERDDLSAPRVAVLSEGIAREVFKTTDVVGQTVVLNQWTRLLNNVQPQTYTIVGVSADTDSFILGRRGNPALFVPFAQGYDPLVAISVRSSNPTAAAGILRTAIRKADPDLAVNALGTGTTLLAGPYFLLRIIGGLASILGVLALVLAMAGLFGVLSHVVARRTREIGIRIAIGADRQRIFSLILRDGCRPVVKGVLIGLIAGVLLRVALRATVVTSLSPIDIGIFVLAPMPFAIAALLACYVPASRASRVDPNVALRDL